MSNNNSEERYTCTLPTSVVEKAWKELREPKTNQAKLEEIDDLRLAFLRAEHGLKLLRSDDKFFLRFLRAKKFSQVKALEMMINYHRQRANWQEVFQKVNSPYSLQAFFDAGCIGVLPKPAKDGSTVVVGWPARKEGMLVTDMVACVVFTVEKLLENEEVQVHGITVIEDLAYYNLAFVKQMTPKLGRRFTKLMQEAMPVRVKSINVVNESKVFDVVLAILRPFLKEKMKRRLHIHGRSYSGLQRAIDVDSLPCRFAGNCADAEVDKYTRKFLPEVYLRQTVLNR